MNRKNDQSKYEYDVKQKISKQQQQYNRSYYKTYQDTRYQDNTSRNSLENNHPINNDSNNNSSYQSETSKIQSGKISTMTLRDLIQIPLPRQQYLKQLSQQRIQQQPQFICVNNQRPYLKASIAHYYKKSFPGYQFIQQIQTIRRINDIKQVLFLTFMITNCYLLQKIMNKAWFKLTCRGSNYFLTGLLFTSLYVNDGINTSNKYQQILNNPGNKYVMNKMLVNFLCQTDKKQKLNILANT